MKAIINFTLDENVKEEMKGITKELEKTFKLARNNFKIKKNVSPTFKTKEVPNSYLSSIIR